MRISFFETSFSAPSAVEFIQAMRRWCEFDCVLTNPELESHYRLYGAEPTLLDTYGPRRSLEALPDSALLERIGVLRERVGISSFRPLIWSDAAYRTKTVYADYDSRAVWIRILSLAESIDRYLDRSQPDFLLHCMGAELERRLFRLICDARRIRSIFLEYIPFYNGYQPARNELGDFYDVPLRAVTETEALEHCARYRDGHAVYYRDRSASLAFRRSHFRTFIDDPKRFEKAWATLSRPVVERRRSLEKRLWAALHQRLYQPPPESRRKILLPLQSVDESTVTVRSRGWSDQEALVRQLALVIPDDCELLVKPHPNDLTGDSPTRLLALRALPSVRLLPATWPMHAVLKSGIDLVVTINSTAGFEAAVLGIPVVALGSSVYSGAGFTIETNSLNDLGSSIAEGLRTRPSTDLLNRLVRKWLARALRGGFSHNPEVFAEDLLNFCQRQLHATFETINA